MDVLVPITANFSLCFRPVDFITAPLVLQGLPELLSAVEKKNK
jgi:hypothetical protein